MIIMDLMMSLHKTSKTTIILITHDNSVAQYAQQRYQLQEGKLILS